MRKKIITTIFKKELLEVVRDKKMLFLVILLPFFMYPVLFTIIGKVGKSQGDKMSNTKVTVLINPEVEGTAIYQELAKLDNIEMKPSSFDKTMLDSLKSTIGLRVTQPAIDSLHPYQPIVAAIYVNKSKDLLKKRGSQIKQVLSNYNEGLLGDRLGNKGLTREFVTPIDIQLKDISSTEAKVGKMLGQFLPMLLLLFIFTGSIYIAIDITAGEKERKTLQTLFISPIKTREIIAGKFLAVFTIGLISAMMNVLSLMFAVFIQVQLMGGDGSGGINMSGLAANINPMGWVFVFLIIFFTTIFISALVLAVVIIANSYKEAQSYVSPLMMLILIPAMLSQMPGMELTTSTAMIPILNICLAIGSVLSGSYSLSLLGLVTISVLFYAGIALFLASRTFNNESVITGQKVSVNKAFGIGKK